MTLRLVVWNCRGRLHEKVAMLRSLRPDVAIVPECACPEVLLRRAIELEACDFAWEGARADCGLAVIAFGPWRLAVDRAHRMRCGSTLPVRVSGPSELRLVAVWAVPAWAHGRYGNPPEPIGAGLERLQVFLAQSPAVIAGDFNASLNCRRSGRRVSRSRLATLLDDLGFVSAYHLSREFEEGEEPQATFFRLGRFPSPHHLDRVLVDRETAARVRRVELQTGPGWTVWSDHRPLVVEIGNDVD